MVKQRKSGRWLVATAAALALAGCSDSSTNPLAGNGQTVSLSFAGVRPPGTSGVQSVRQINDTLVVAVGTDTLRITSVEVVLRKIELKRAGIVVNCDSTADEDACEEFETGAMLVSLPLTPGVETAVSVPVDSGTYSKVEFKIHKPGNDSVDQAFNAANPTWPQDVSIRVIGTFNGTPFTYTTSLDAEQEYTFNPPLVVDASGTAANLTIRLDVSTWFKTGGGLLVNPATALPGGANESLVKDNIKNSIKAFEDDDHDGDERDG